MGGFAVLFLIGRIVFAALFLLNGITHLTKLEDMSGYAASKGVPAPRAMTVLGGLMILLGGVSVLLWWWVAVGAWLLAFFLLAAAFKMHDFWALEDPMERTNQQAHFWKNVSLAGAAICFYAVAMAPEILL